MRILVVEDDKEIQELITYFLSKEGYEVDQADDGLEGLRLLKEKQHNLVVLDLMLPNLDGKNFQNSKRYIFRIWRSSYYYVNC